MADTARVTQSIVLLGTLQTGNVRVTQSILLMGVGVGIAFLLGAWQAMQSWIRK